MSTPPYPQYPHQTPGPQQYPPRQPGAALPHGGAHGYGAQGMPVANPPTHSGVGIASLILAILSVLGLVATMVVAVIMAAGDPEVFENEEAPATMAVGLAALLCLFLSLIGVALAIGGMVMRDRKRLFPILGLTINGVILLLVIGLMVLGAVSG